MNNYTYKEDIEDIKAPGLKIIALILYIIPVPLIFIAFRDFFFIILVDQGRDMRWLTGIIILLTVAGYSYVAAIGISKLKPWAPKVTIFGLFLGVIAISGYLLLDPQFVTLREVNSSILIAIIIVLMIAILVIRKNKSKFSN